MLRSSAKFQLDTIRHVSRDKIFEYTDSLPSLPNIRNSIPLCQKIDSRYTPGKYGKSTNGILRYTNRMFSIRLVYFRILHERYGKSTNGILRYTNRMFSIRLVYFRILHGRYRKSTNGILRYTNRMFSIRLVYFKIL